MPIPRFRVRTLMIAVAVVGLIGAATGRFWQLRTLYSRRAAMHASKELWANTTGRWTRITAPIQFSDESDRDGVWVPPPPRSPAEVRLEDERIEQQMRAADRECHYHAKMQKKYEYAAAHPWLPVPPDPPEPE